MRALPFARPVACACALLAAACAQPTHGAGARPDGFRLVSGVLAVPRADALGREVTGLQVAAIAIGAADDPARVDVFPSTVFDVAHVETASFTAPVDGARSFVLVLQVPSASTRGPGSLVATLHFPDGRGDGTLLPPGALDVQLGALTVETGASTAANVLIVGDANNPLSQIDTDGDHIADLADDDDDGDGVPDATDPDVGGDGIDDVDQLLTSLPDADHDGVPDLLQS